MAKTTERVKDKRCRQRIARFLSVLQFHDDNPNVSAIVFAKLDEIRRKQSVIGNKKLVIKFGGKTFVRTMETKYSTIPDSPDNPFSKTIFNALPSSSDDDQSVKDSRNTIFNGLPSSSSDHDDQSVEDSRNNLTVSDGGLDLKDYIANIGGSNLELMFQKQLTKTDVTKTQGRLLIPEKQVKINPGFLREDERNTLVTNKEGLKVTVLDSRRRTWTLNLGLWSMSNNQNYVLKSGWNQVVAANGLEDKKMIQIWSFRVNQQIYFAIVPFPSL